jgi:hypothetical protein
VSNLKAGRELDALIAKKVMGWHKMSHNELCIANLKGDWWIDQQENLHFPPHPYSTEIAAAWQVVERIRKIIPKQTSTQTFSFQLCQTGIPGKWFCSFTINECRNRAPRYLSRCPQGYRVPGCGGGEIAMATFEQKSHMTVEAQLTLNETELRFLDGLSGYSDADIRDCLLTQLGMTYMAAHIGGLYSILNAVRKDVRPILNRTDDARAVFAGKKVAQEPTA